MPTRISKAALGRVRKTDNPADQNAMVASRNHLFGCTREARGSAADYRNAIFVGFVRNPGETISLETCKNIGNLLLSLGKNAYGKMRAVAEDFKA